MKKHHHIAGEADGCASIIVSVVFILFLLLIPVGCNALFGVGGLGPKRTVENAEVVRLYIDSGSSKENGSHYMVTTDKGVFEIQNGWFLGVWNADELYGPLKVGKHYNFTTKGNKVVGWFMQEYPYITAAQEVTQ